MFVVEVGIYRHERWEDESAFIVFEDSTVATPLELLLQRLTCVSPRKTHLLQRLSFA